MIILGDEADAKLSFAELEIKYSTIPNLKNVEVGTINEAPQKDKDRSRQSKTLTGPKLTVGSDRIWTALCGHGPDSSKVPPFEFALLCAIARTRHEGILQGPLTQITQQDKRTVPQRTDRLRDKGYIDKRVVYRVNGQKTSRLILRRFVDQPQKELAIAAENAENDAEGLATDTTGVNPSGNSDTHDPAAQDTLDADEDQHSAQSVPQWNPDRALPNVLHDLAVNAGAVGITNNSARHEVTGNTVKRSTEAILSRLSHSSLKAQPESALDLALIRSWEAKNGIGRYVHRTFKEFKQLVDAGQATWSSVSGGDELARKLQAGELSNKDDFGFLQQSQPDARLRHSDLDTTVSSAGATDAHIRAGEPILLEHADDHLVLGTRAGDPEDTSKLSENTSLTNLASISSPAKQKAMVTRTNNVGRRQKYAPGTESFWPGMMRLKKEELYPGSTKGAGKLSIIQDSEILAWYATRPDDFDTCIKQSIENKLPLPDEPDKVSKVWVDKVRDYLTRSDYGVYFSPSGCTSFVKGRKSCIVTIKSSRVNKEDLQSFPKPSEVLFSSSSIAHTTRDYSLDPWVNVGSWVLQWRSRQTLPQKAEETQTKVKQKATSNRANDLIAAPITSISPKKRERPTATTDAGQDDPATVSQPKKIRKISRPSHKNTAMPDNEAPQLWTVAEASAKVHAAPNHEQSTANLAQVGFADALPNAAKLPNNTSDRLSKNCSNDGQVAQDENTAIHALDYPAFSEADLLQHQNPITESDKVTDKIPQNLANLPDLHIAQDGLENLTTMIEDIDYEDDPSVMEEDFDDTETPKTQKPKSKPKPRVFKPRQTNAMYQKLVLELVHLCNGLMPNSLSNLKRAISTKAAEAGLDVPTIKILRTVVKNVTRSGKLKVMTIAFQSGGFNHTKEILALPETQFLDSHFITLQQNIVALPYDEDFMPPELEQEWNRAPSKVLRSDLLEEVEQELSTPKKSRQTSTAASSPAPATPKSSARPKRQIKKRKDSLAPSVPDKNESPSPPPVPPSINNGFLSLKVPKIGTIQTSSSFTSHYFDLPSQPEPIRFDASAAEAASRTALPTPAAERRSGVRIPRTSTFKPGQGIQWRKRKNLPLPKSLKAILTHSCIDDERDLTDADGTEIFEDKVSAMEAGFMHSIYHVAAWEIENWDDLQEQKSGEWNFVNYLVPKNQFEYVPLQVDVDFTLVRFQGTYKDDIISFEEAFPEVESWDVFAAVSKTSRAKQKRVDAQAEKQKKKRQVEDVDFDDESGFAASEDEELSAPLRKSKAEPKAKKRKIEEDKRKGKRAGIVTRGIGMRNLSKDEAHRILTAFVLVKVLAGGLDRYLDFDLVSRLLPEETDVTLQERLKVLNHHYNNDMDAYTSDFQVKYLDALAEDRVPSVDYDDLDSTDWRGIHEWAVRNINAEIKPDLALEMPPTREELIALNDIEVPDPKPVRQLFNQNLNFSIAMKEDAWASTIAGSAANLPQPADAIGPVLASEEDENDISMARARSWLLATVLTSAHTFDAKKTKQKLSLLASNKNDLENLIDSTIKKLHADKILVKQSSIEAVTDKDGNSYSGTHGWKLGTKFFDKFELNRVITPTMLKDAAWYKLQTLDAIFAAGKTVTFSKHPNIKDGAMVAVFNLLAQGMIVIKPGHDVPASRYGLDHEEAGYKTRSMDRDVMGFSTVLEPTRAYVYGDPVIKSHAVPRGGLDQGDFMGLIPMWFDINGVFLPQIWEMVLGAVTGIVSCRPGVSTVEIVRMLNWVMSKHDLELVLDYLTTCDTICKSGTGWETTDWWWLAVGCGHGHEPGVQWEHRV